MTEIPAALLAGMAGSLLIPWGFIKGWNFVRSLAW